ncbi:MAG: pyridoxal 5'-phosphate synthase glutaminase subunit PdxT [Ignisphaera sp.]
MVVVGILAVQGDYLEHAEILKEMNIEVKYIKRAEDLNSINALIIPGGESTTIGSILKYRSLGETIARQVENGLPVMGTCAGAIILASKVVDRVVGETNQYTLKLMNTRVVRNVFGRQRNSFTTKIDIENIGTVEAAFIRAPGIVDAWSPARITGYLNHPFVGRVGVAAEQETILALTFHPEITGDKKVYEYFISKAMR